MTGSGIRKYVCSYCQKSYGKSEHLKRHERVHTGVKPYTCPLCKSVFSRQDSLSRHVKRHEEESHHDIADASGNTPVSPALPSRTSSRTTRSTPQRQSNDAQAHTPISQRQQQSMNSRHHDGHLPLAISSDSATQDDSFFHLNWPDSQILLDSILSTDLPAWSANAAMSLPNLNMADPGPNLQLPSFSTFPEPPVPESVTNDGAQAVRDLSHMITNAWSVNVTAEALSLGLTTAFLDNCLQAFWDQFVPTFPMVHAPTFVFRDWTYPLLLNAIAIGSLFTDRQEDRTMGESLWRLAYTAVATSWQILIKHQGPYDSCRGVQLVLTALLGQVYAIHSQNENIRMVSRIYHSLGFFWAQDSGMYDVDKEYPITSSEANESPEERDQRWRTWASHEIQLRAMVGHYILDGQIAQYNGGRLSQRHTANPLSVPCSNDIFTASTSEEWARVIGRTKRKRPVFRDLITSLFSHHVHVGHLGTVWILPTIKVVLEALKSLTYEIRGAPSPIVGCPSRADIAYALSRTYQLILKNTKIGPGQRVQGIVQWHATALEACIDTNQLCQDLCHRLYLHDPRYPRQTVLNGKQPDPEFDLDRWRQSPQSRRALLHALAIHDSLAELPLGHAKSMHLPAAVFTAALVYAAARTAPGPSAISVPTHIHWESLIQINLDDRDNNHGSTDDLSDAEADADSASDTATSPTDVIRRYLHGISSSPSKSQSIMTPRNLPHEMGLFTMTLHNSATVWGVAHEFLAILAHLATGYRD